MSVVRWLFCRRVPLVPAVEKMPAPPPVSLEPDKADMWPALVQLDREATERLLTIQRLRGEIEVRRKEHPA